MSPNNTSSRIYANYDSVIKQSETADTFLNPTAQDLNKQPYS